MNKGGPGVHPCKLKKKLKWCNQSYSGAYFVIFFLGGNPEQLQFIRNSWQVCYCSFPIHNHNDHIMVNR